VPAYMDEQGVRVEFFGDEIDRISVIDILTGNANEKLESVTFYPAKQFVTPASKMKKAIGDIRKELDERVAEFERDHKYLEAQRIRQRTEYDIEMMQEMGFCQGIENYSRHLSGRPVGSRPHTLIDFFQGDFLLMIDESHVSIPQIGGMYEGDRSRKTTLVDFGFRLPSALDNRPLRFNEFMEVTGQRLYVSATPANFELQNSVVGNDGYIPHKRERIGEEETKPARLPRISGNEETAENFDPTTEGRELVVEQIIRPTGLLDPVITMKPLKGQIDETIELCRQRIEKGERVLVTTLTKRTAEDLTDYLRNVDLKVRYIHAEVDAIERVEILRALRAAEFDILVGINLLREGLDLPEVSLVCILDADKEGYLRSETSLIQTAGRAARHVNGEVVLFADEMTKSIKALIRISEYRRRKQIEHNEKHGITPTSVIRGKQESLHTVVAPGRGRDVETSVIREGEGGLEVVDVIREMEAEMAEASSKLEFERAALLRDQISDLRREYNLEDPKGGSFVKATVKAKKRAKKKGGRKYKAKFR
ncbi:MAG: helicase-related protein, partial [Verrucomicrobiota bacterium]